MKRVLELGGAKTTQTLSQKSPRKSQRNPYYLRHFQNIACNLLGPRLLSFLRLLENTILLFALSVDHSWKGDNFWPNGETDGGTPLDLATSVFQDPQQIAKAQNINSEREKT